MKLGTGNALLKMQHHLISICKCFKLLAQKHIVQALTLEGVAIVHRPQPLKPWTADQTNFTAVLVDTNTRAMQ